MGKDAKMYKIQCLGDLTRQSGTGHFTHLQTEGHIIVNRHMRKQCIALKHDTQASLVRLEVRDVFSIKNDAANCRRSEASNHLQSRCLSTTRRAKQTKKLALLNGQTAILHGREVAVTFH